MAVSPNAVAIAIAFARAQVGDWYLFGATGPDRWDCSGLVMVSFGKAGVILPRTTGMMVNMGTPVAESELRPGDLVFPNFHHVQIYTGNGMIIEAADSGTQVREVKMWGFWRARRVVSGAQSLKLPPGVDIGLGTATGVITGSGTVAADAIDQFAAFGGIIKWITDARNWLRIAEMTAGFALLIIAVFGMSGVRDAVVKGAASASGA